MLRNKITEILKEYFKKRKDLFLIDFELSLGNKVNVTIDGDNGVTVDDCVQLSRSLENNLDRDSEDFSLEVSSAGANTPLVHRRQYVKNIGRILNLVTCDNEKYEAVLKDVSDQNILLEWKTREPKPIGKGKVTVQKSVKINYNDIDSARIKLVF
ncbi:MAG: ribosome assembly cofactor RimP [Flavobacteriaceae bacterium]|nr:ribosome assembly cofactor RimP [Flavobacteriaceae bacterium]